MPLTYAQKIRALALSPAPAAPDARLYPVVMRLRGVTYRCASLLLASEMYCAERDESGEGASTFPDAKIVTADGRKFRVSYNGRVWADLGRPWQPGDQSEVLS